MENNLGSQHDDKVLLRKKFRDIRRRFRSQEGRSVAQQLQQNLQKIAADFGGKDVQCCLYRARRDEAPCVLSPVTDYFYPALNGEELEFRKPVSKAAFQSNELAFEEPIADKSAVLDLNKPVIVFCPAVAIDQDGHRLGLGKGYYDRFFARHPQALRVGVVFHVQLSPQTLPAESWDQPMDWMVSEKMILRVKATRSLEAWM